MDVKCLIYVVTTLKSQRRNVLDFLTAATSAARTNQPAPSLLPDIADSSDQVINAT